VDDVACVRRARARCGLGDELDRGLDRHRSVRHLLKGAPFHELHHEERNVVVRAEIEDRDDVGVRYLSDRLSLTEETDEELGVFGVVTGEELDRHRSPETFVLGAPDLGHAPAPEGRDETIALLYEIAGLHGT
jgi:hypothetical protein